MAYKGPKISALHGDALKARIAHLVATHNTAAVPTKYLTGANAKYARERVKNINLDTPVTPGSSLTNRDLAHEAQSTVATTYQPQEQGIATQQGQLVNQKANLPQYYQNYLDVLKGAQTQAGIDAKHTADNIQALGTSAQTAQTSGDTSALKALQSDAERLGVSADPKAAQDATNAAAASRSVSDAQAGTAQLLGQANANFLRMTQAGAGLAEQEGLGKIAAQQNQLGQQRTALKREEGLANQAYRTKRRSEEVTNVATSALAGANIAAKAAGVSQGAARVKVAQKNADTARRRQQQAGQPSTVAKPPSNYTGSPADWNNLSQGQRDQWVTKHPTSTSKGPKGPKPPKPVTGPGSLPAGKEASIVTQIERVYSTLKTPPNWPTGPKAGKPMTPAEVYDSLKRGGALTPGKPLDPRILDVARSRLHNNGAVGQFGLDAAHALGIHVGGRWKIATGSSSASVPYTRPGGRVS